MIIFNKEAMEYCIMGNNLNPIELIALGSERIQTMVCKPAKKPLEKVKECGPICLHFHQKLVLNEAVPQKTYLGWA